MGTALPSFHGPHVPAHPQPGAEKLRWRVAQKTSRCTRERVISFSCSCRSTVFELRAAGGVYYIRRTDHGRPENDQWETESYLHRRALQVWDWLLIGLAY